MRRIIVTLFANNLPHKLIITVSASKNLHKHAGLINKLDRDKSQVFRKSSHIKMVTIIYNLPEIATGPEAYWITNDHTSILCEYY